MNNAQMKAQIEQLLAENAKLKSAGVKRLSMKVSAKGGVSVYGLGRFPVTLYQTQWVRLLDISEDIKQFLTDNAADLTDKDSPKPVAKNYDVQGNALPVETKEARALREMDEEDNELTPAQYREIVKRMGGDTGVS